MRTCDISSDAPGMPEGIWIYRPHSHKTQHHGKDRRVLLGPHAQAIVKPWLRSDDPEAFLFSPAAGRALFNAKRRANAKVCRKKLKGPQKGAKRRPGRKYSTSAYNVAIRKACLAAEVPHWHPNQLRHNAATRIRAAYGIEVARIILGHAHLNTTEIYAEADLLAAAQAVAKSG